MYVKVKSGGCSGRIVVTGGKPKCVALLSDELRAWRFLQKLNYKRRDGIQQTALTMQLFCTVTSSEKCCQHRSAEHVFNWKRKIQENKVSLLLALINLFPFSLMITRQISVLFPPLRGAGVAFNCSLLYSESSFISCSLIGNLNDNDQTAATLSFHIHNNAAQPHTQRVCSRRQEEPSRSAVCQGSWCAGKEELWQLGSIPSAALSTNTASFIRKSLAVEHTAARVGKLPPQLHHFTTHASKGWL